MSLTVSKCAWRGALHGEPALRTAVTHGASAPRGHRRATSLRSNTGEQSVRAKGAAAHHAACLLSAARSERQQQADIAAGHCRFLKKSRQYSEESKKPKPPNPRVPSSLSSPRNRSAHFHKVQQRSRCQRSDAHRKRECHTEAKFSACLKRRIGATGSSALSGERAQCARIEGAFMCRQTLPSFHCYLPAQARTHARWAGRHQWECGGAGRRHGGHMWSSALQGKAASSLKNDEGETPTQQYFSPL